MSEIRTDAKTETGEVVAAWILTVLTVGYFLPWAIAASRGKSNSSSIAILNFLLGWTVIGWIVALVMACGAHQSLAVSTPSVAAPATWVDPATGRTCAMNPATGQPMFINPVTGLQLVEPEPRVSPQP